MYRRNRAILGKNRGEHLSRALASGCLPEELFESSASGPCGVV